VREHLPRYFQPCGADEQSESAPREHCFSVSIDEVLEQSLGCKALGAMGTLLEPDRKRGGSSIDSGYPWLTGMVSSLGQVPADDFP
jgi:hypothetical protein